MSQIPAVGEGARQTPRGGSTQGKHSPNPYDWSVCGASRREVKQTREGLWGSSWSYGKQRRNRLQSVTPGTVFDLSLRREEDSPESLW